MNVNAGRRSLIVVAAGAVLALFGAFVLASGSETAPASPDDAVPATQSNPGAEASVLVDPDSVYDPVRAGEETPRTFRQLLRRDQIEPVYDPVFTGADSVDWPDESLVIGVEGDATAKAYPVTHLNSREMVNDEIDGDPILVSW